MIRIVVTLLPGGDPKQAKMLGAINVANLSDLADESSYLAKVYEPDALLEKITPAQLERSFTGGFVLQHRRAAGWKSLVAKVMNRLINGA